MSELLNQEKNIDAQVKEVASAYPYPPTPDLSRKAMDRLRKRSFGEGPSFRQWAWAAGLALLLLAAASLSVPTVRAQILEFLQVGGIKIFLTETTPVPTQHTAVPKRVATEISKLDKEQSHTPISTQEAGGKDTPTGTDMTDNETPETTFQRYPSLDDLAGETTLEAAQKWFGYPLRLPTYPPDLGSPDRVFKQDLGGRAVLMVWVDPQEPDSIRLDLLVLSSGAFASKGGPEVIQETRVSGRPAVWTEGRHFLHLGGSRYQGVTLVVEGSILIWEEGDLTYRLETDLPIEEAVKVAESLK